MEDPGVGGRIILQWIFRKWNGFIGLRDRWQAVVNVVINLQFP